MQVLCKEQSHLHDHACLVIIDIVDIGHVTPAGGCVCSLSCTHAILQDDFKSLLA